MWVNISEFDTRQAKLPDELKVRVTSRMVYTDGGKPKAIFLWQDECIYRGEITWRGDELLLFYHNAHGCRKVLAHIIAFYNDILVYVFVTVSRLVRPSGLP